MSNIKEIIKIKYEAGATAPELSEKYKIKANTINVWAKRYRWSKKNQKKRNLPSKNGDRRNDKDKINDNGNDKMTERRKKNIVEKIIEKAGEELKKEKKHSKLTEKEKNFIRNYFECKFNIKMATLKSGYSHVSQGFSVMRKDKIKRIIERIRKAYVELDPLRIDADYLLEELTKNHFIANGTLKQKNAEVIEKRIRKPVVVEVGGKKIIKYEEATEAELFEYEAAMTDIRASNQSLQLIAKLKGLDRQREEKDEKHNAMIELLANITKAVDDDDK